MHEWKALQGEGGINPYRFFIVDRSGPNFFARAKLKVKSTQKILWIICLKQIVKSIDVIGKLDFNNWQLMGINNWRLSEMGFTK